jgi:hypothetical protein
MNVEQACQVMHDAYEKAAVGAGWETNPASRKPWADVPEANKVTMRAAVGALLAAIEAEQETTTRCSTCGGLRWIAGPPGSGASIDCPTCTAAEQEQTPCPTCGDEVLMAGEFGVDPLGLKRCPTCCPTATEQEAP